MHWIIGWIALIIAGQFGYDASMDFLQFMIWMQVALLVWIIVFRSYTGR